MDMSGLFAAQSMLGMNMGNIYSNAFLNSMGLGGMPAPFFGGQPLFGAPQPLYNGIFDPSQVIPGLGIAASGIPQQPPREVFIRYGRMQENAMNEARAFLENFKEEMESRKDEVFYQNHYVLDDKGNVGLFQVNEKGEFVTDKDGKLIPDPKGKTKLEQGGETYEQNKARRQYEKELTRQTKARHEAEAEQLRERTAAAQDAFMSDPSTTLNPEKAEQYRNAMEQLAREEIAIAERHMFEDLSVGIEGLPDPKNPAQPLTAFLNQKQAEYQDMKLANQQEIESSPEGQQIRDYFERMQEFTDRQKAAVRAFLANRPPGFFG
jgi:hypothetical protein